MRFEFDGTHLIAIREKGDPVFYGHVNAKGESRLLYFIKNELNKIGFDLIKKRAWKDGHLVDELQQYLRTRKPTSVGPHVFLINNRWAVEGLDETWRQDGHCKLMVAFNIYGRRTDTEDRRLFSLVVPECDHARR